MDFSTAMIWIRTCLKALPGPDGKRVHVLADLKTDRSRRTMQLPRDAATVLRALKAQQAKDHLRLGAAYRDNGAGVWRRLRRPAVAAGCPPTRPGHLNSSVTRNVYRHQLADKLTKAPAAMDAILHPGEVSGS